MTIAPAPLLQLLNGSRVVQARDAIKATIAAILPGVTVKPHPGKLDINDLVEKENVAVPGVLVGYVRVRELGDPGGTFTMAVDWVAYIVVEDWVAPGANPPRRIEREDVAHAIGLQLLRILRDPDAGSWGLGGVEVPAMDPAPAFSPVLTLKSAEQGVALYAVTWTQGLVQEGARFFGGATPAADASRMPPPDAGDDVVFFELPPGSENDYPPELLAHFRRGGSGGSAA